MCTSPNYMIWRGDWTKNDRPKLSFVGHHQFNDIIRATSSGIPFIEVPCGKCLECRIQYARTWADRCVLESKNSPYNYFITLTYDDEHLPPGNSLDPKEMQLFMHRLRKHYKRKGFDGSIRFLLCGEYGDKSFRPHYHLLLFNCPITDLSYTFYQEVDGKLVKHERPPSKNDDLYFSQTIYDLWRDSSGSHKGMISVGMFSYDTAAYVSQYVTKKCNPNNYRIYEELGIYPEFLRMSNKPGIGANYFHEHPHLHYTGKMVIPNDGEAHLSSVPRYFDKLFIQKYGQDVFDDIANKRAFKKITNLKTYLSSNKNADKEAKIRDYNLHKLHHLKECL